MTFSPEQKKRLPPGAPVINVHVPKGRTCLRTGWTRLCIRRLIFSPRCFRSTRPGRFCAIPGCCTRGFGSFCRGEPDCPLYRPLSNHWPEAGCFRGHPANLWKTLAQEGSTRKIPACSARLWAGFAVWERPAESWKLGSNDKSRCGNKPGAVAIWYFATAPFYATSRRALPRGEPVPDKQTGGGHRKSRSGTRFPAPESSRNGRTGRETNEPANRQ